MKRALAVLVLLGGCASAPPDAAHVETRAELGEARVVRVDGNAVLAGSGIELAPGRHRLTVFCAFNTGMMIGDARNVTREIDVDLAAGGRYRLDARMASAPCSLRLAEEN
jgi:hypothetical protein